MNKLNEDQKIKIISFADRFIFAALLCFLALVIFTSGSANLRADSVDYYTILQGLTDSNKKPVVDNTHFVEQRSPGYSIISSVPYYFASFAIEPFVKTGEIIDKGQNPPEPPGGAPGPENKREPGKNGPPGKGGSEMMGIPSTFLPIKDIFFKNFYLENSGALYEWKIIFALLLTSYVFLFAGIIFSIKTLALRWKKITGFSLPMITIITSTVFMQNIISTPAYATMAAFGLSSIFCFFYVASFDKKSFTPQFLAGIFLGLLVLTRLEAVLIAGVLFLFLVFYKKWDFLKNLILGALLSLAILLLYNFSQFGTPFHFGILKGDINKIGFDPGYIYANLFNPKSGILFWSFLTSIGLIGLFLGNKKYLKILGAASLALIALLIIRVPIMYKCIGGAPIDLGGVMISCPSSMEDALMLVRSDANRYLTVLVPFAVLGLQNLIIFVGEYYKTKKAGN